MSLFSGIGGFDLAAEWVGWNNVMQVEIDHFCQKVLQKNFPNVPKHDDIRTFNKDCVDGTVDIISGGFPCQPFSTAGKRLGSSDERHLWPEMRRVVSEFRPTWVVGENVPGIISLALEQVCLDLENEGYAVWPLIIPACAVDAPHKRDRVWILAYANGIRRQDEQEKYGKPIHNEEWNNTTEEQVRKKQQCGPLESSSLFPNTRCQRLQLSRQKTVREKRHIPSRYDRWASEPNVGRVADGLQRRLDRHRPRLKAIGNAIVPQVAYELFTMIDKITSMGRSQCQQ